MPSSVARAGSKTCDMPSIFSGPLKSAWVSMRNRGSRMWPSRSPMRSVQLVPTVLLSSAQNFGNGISFGGSATHMLIPPLYGRRTICAPPRSAYGNVPHCRIKGTSCFVPSCRVNSSSCVSWYSNGLFHSPLKYTAFMVTSGEKGSREPTTEWIRPLVFSWAHRLTLSAEAGE